MQRSGHLAVLVGGDDNAQGFDLIGELVDFREAFCPILRGNFCGALCIDIANADQLCLRQRRVDSRVVLTQTTDTDYTDFDFSIHSFKPRRLANRWLPSPPNINFGGRLPERRDPSPAE